MLKSRGIAGVQLPLSFEAVDAGRWFGGQLTFAHGRSWHTIGSFTVRKYDFMNDLKVKNKLRTFNIQGLMRTAFWNLRSCDANHALLDDNWIRRKKTTGMYINYGSVIHT
jgi:hypothetical protein